MCRKIANLEWAALCPKPLFPPKRLRGVRGRGLAYERRVGKHLQHLIDSGHLPAGRLFSGQWFQFRDDNGLGYAQPDHFIVQKTQVLLVECKLTQTDEAWEQIDRLYRPLLRHLFGLPVVGLQVCRNLRELDSSIIHSPDAIRDGSTWHWLGG